jgi:hypothetical protein
MDEDYRENNILFFKEVFFDNFIDNRTEEPIPLLKAFIIIGLEVLIVVLQNILLTY